MNIESLKEEDTEEAFADKDSIRLMDPCTLEEEFLMNCPAFCHFISNTDNSKIAGDGRLESMPFVYLADVKSKEIRKQCYHGTSWKSYGSSQDSHVHPAFSPDGDMVVFTSDMEGLPCVWATIL